MKDLRYTYTITILIACTAYLYAWRLVDVPLEILRLPFACSAAFLVAMVVLTICLGPISPLFIRSNLEKIGLVNKRGEAPLMVGLHQSQKVENGIVIEFENRNIPRDVWDDKRSDLEAALNLFILSIKDGRNRRRILVEAVPADEGLPEIIPWDDQYIPDDDNSICLGIGLTGPVTKRLDLVPHTLVAGSSGSGKSIFTRGFLYQSLRKRMTVCCVDFKGGIDFVRLTRHPYFKLITTPDELLECLKEYSVELENRKQMLLRTESANLSEYNNKNPEHQHRRVLIAIDELAEVMDKTGRTREEKTMIEEITGLLAQIARQGRAVGIHLLLSQQRPDADVLPGQIKSNIDTRIAGRCDTTLSTIILGNGDANDMIPKDAQGLFLVNGADTDELTLFRAFWFDPSVVLRDDWAVVEPVEVWNEEDDNGG